MATKGKRTLKLKLAFFATLLVVFVAGSFSYFILTTQKRAIIKTQEENRFDMVRSLAQVARQSIIVDDDTHIVNFMDLMKKLNVTYAMVLNPDGHVRVHTDPLLIDKLLDDDATKKTLVNQDRENFTAQNLTLDDGQNILDLSLPVIIGNNPPEYHGVARIGFDKKDIQTTTDRLFQNAVANIVKAFIIALFLGLLGAVLLATFITSPLKTLAEGSRKIGEGKLDHRITVHTRDELADLANDFNAMAQKLGEVDEMKRDFVSSVTHELRSPMTSIRGYMDLLLQGAAGDLSDLQRDYLTVIKNNAVRLGRFIDNLLDVSKIEAHKLKLTPETQDIFQLAHEMEVLFKPQMTDKKIAFKNKVSTSLSKAFVDKERLAEVFINLTSNAIKFTPDQGEILITATEGSNYLEVGLHDTGVGIPQDQLDKVFNKFEQIKSGQTVGGKKQKGTGLGLSIAKGIIEAHGGKIRVESPAPSGKGTVFYFTIPIMTDEILAKIKSKLDKSSATDEDES